MEFQLLDILVLIGLSQGFVFGLAVLNSKLFKGTPNRFLAYSVLLVVLIGLNDWLSVRDFDETYYFIDLFGDDFPWVLLFYVPLWIYFLRSVDHPLGKDRKAWWFTAPFFLFLALNLVINLDVDFGLYSLPEVNTFKTWVYFLEYYTGLLLAVGLCAASFGVIWSSKAEGWKKNWLLRIWGATGLIIGLWIFVLFIPSDWIFADRIWESLIWIVVSFFIYWLTFKGLYQLQMQSNNNLKASIKTVAPKPVLDESNAYFQKLESLLKDEALYKDPDHGRESIAEQLGISPSYLSKLVNEVTGDNFSAFINSYRVEAVKKMLLDPEYDQYSLTAIGMEAGFRSKSVFYTSFKKATGLTPNAFKKAHQ